MKGIKALEDAANLKEEIENGDVEVLVSFGDKLEGINLDNVNFKAFMSLHMPKHEGVNVLLPDSSYFEIIGTFTKKSEDGTFEDREVNACIKPFGGISSSEILDNLWQGVNNAQQGYVYNNGTMIAAIQLLHWQVWFCLRVCTV